MTMTKIRTIFAEISNVEKVVYLNVPINFPQRSQDLANGRKRRVVVRIAA